MFHGKNWLPDIMKQFHEMGCTVLHRRLFSLLQPPNIIRRPLQCSLHTGYDPITQKESANPNKFNVFDNQLLNWATLAGKKFFWLVLLMFKTVSMGRSRLNKLACSSKEILLPLQLNTNVHELTTKAFWTGEYQSTSYFHTTYWK